MSILSKLTSKYITTNGTGHFYKKYLCKQTLKTSMVFRPTNEHEVVGIISSLNDLKLPVF